jgi:hypothetical protein
VLKNGKAVLSGSVDDLKAGSKIVEGIFPSDSITVNGLASDKRIGRIERTGRILRLTVTAGGDELARQLAQMGAQSVRIVDLNLEDIFLNAVDGGSDADVVESA